MRKRRHGIVNVLIVLGLLILQLGTPRLARAAAMTAVKDVIEDSRPSTVSNHTLTFTIDSNADEGDDITVTFPVGFTMGALDEDDVDITDDSVDLTTEANCAGADEASVIVVGQEVEITICAGNGGAIAGGSIVVVEIGDHASASGAGTNQVTNHATPTTYDMEIAGTLGDDGTAVIAIIATIEASVSVAESLSFTVAGVAAAACSTLGGGDITTTSSTIPFGSPAANTFQNGCHDLDVDTNAGSGYSVTIMESDQMAFGGETIADGTCDGGCDETTFAVWTNPALNGLGYCLDDTNGAPSGQDCSATPLFKIFASLGDSENPEEIMSEGTEVTDDQIEIGYRITIGGSQAAGSYTNDIIFVATPTY